MHNVSVPAGAQATMQIQEMHAEVSNSTRASAAAFDNRVQPIPPPLLALLALAPIDPVLNPNPNPSSDESEIPPEYRSNAPAGHAHGGGWVHSHIATRLATAGADEFEM